MKIWYNFTLSLRWKKKFTEIINTPQWPGSFCLDTANTFPYKLVQMRMWVFVQASAWRFGWFIAAYLGNEIHKALWTEAFNGKMSGGGVGLVPGALFWKQTRQRRLNWGVCWRWKGWQDGPTAEEESALWAWKREEMKAGRKDCDAAGNRGGHVNVSWRRRRRRGAILWRRANKSFCYGGKLSLSFQLRL